MNKKVLIVDDEEEIVAFMGKFLKRLGIDSVLAISGEQALEIYNKETFDCVFLDVHLGGISGIDVLKKIKKINPDAKVVIITGSMGSDVQQTVTENGAIDYIQKPIDLSDFKKKILTYVK